MQLVFGIDVGFAHQNTPQIAIVDVQLFVIFQFDLCFEEFHSPNTLLFHRAIEGNAAAR